MINLNAPRIVSQLPNETNLIAGGTATFRISVTNAIAPVYQWQFNGVSIPGNSNVLVLTNVSTNDAGNFDVVISSLGDPLTTTSSLETLNVLLPPSITVQPVSQSTVTGYTVTLGVTVSGDGPFTYQWEFRGTNLPPIISTVAGTGTNGYSGDGGPAVNADLSYPGPLTTDSAGNLYVADTGNDCIRKVNTEGIITTIAGNGINGYSGDGGPATNASFNSPSGLTLDAAGNLYISDYYNDCIREMSTNGIVTTIAGNGTAGDTGDGGPAIDATLDGPEGLAMDLSGNLFIAEYSGDRVREIQTNGTIVTFAGNGNPGFSGDGGVATNAEFAYPMGLALDSTNDLFIVDSANDRIRMVSTNGIIATVAGDGSGNFSGDGGLATLAILSWPSGVALDAAGNLFIADSFDNRVRDVFTNGIITTIAGDGQESYSGDGGAATNAALSFPRAVTTDAAGNPYIADFFNNRIRKVTNWQGPTLILSDVTTANAGSYYVIVTGPDGRATSSNVVISVYPSAAPSITIPAFSAGVGIQLQVSGVPGFNYTVEASTNLVDWVPLMTNGSPFIFTDTNANFPQCFYRSVYIP